MSALRDLWGAVGGVFVTWWEPFAVAAAFALFRRGPMRAGVTETS